MTQGIEIGIGPGTGTDPADDVIRLIDRMLELPDGLRPPDRVVQLAGLLAGCLRTARVVIELPPFGVHRWPLDGAIEASIAEPDADPPVSVALGHDRRSLARLRLDPAATARWRAWPELRGAVTALLDDLRSDLQIQQSHARAAGHAARLADDRQRTAGELERQRYALERDLHDGVQHHLAALQAAVGLVEHQFQVDPGESVVHLRRLQRLLDGARTVLRAVADGLPLPPAQHGGLATALEIELGALGSVTMDVDPVVAACRYPTPVETAVYLVCLEAVGNTFKHAPRAQVTLTLRSAPGGLSFEVSDTGPGFEARQPTPLPQLADRLAAVDGRLTVSSARSAGTRVSGFVPIRPSP